MDAKLFRLPQTPNYYAASQAAAPWTESIKRSRAAAPAEDARFPGWAAPQSDGRLVTDYRPRCETNIPVRSQQITRVWLQRNADDIIRISRERTAQVTGMNYGVDSTTEPPSAVEMTCTKAGCRRSATGETNGIGMSRGNNGAVPDLFGTYSPSSFLPAPAPHIAITINEEGGRNTRRS
jgi:hypothetical protein